VILTATDGTSGTELWRSDGTAAGTEQVADLAPGTDSGVRSALWPWGDRALFLGDDGSGELRLYATDGTSAGTVALTDDVSAFPLTPASRVRTTGTHAFFAGTTDEEGHELWAVSLPEAP
jgi:ELWxxDGT repeat protein